MAKVEKLTKYYLYDENDKQYEVKLKTRLTGKLKTELDEHIATFPTDETLKMSIDVMKEIEEKDLSEEESKFKMIDLVKKGKIDAERLVKLQSGMHKDLDYEKAFTQWYIDAFELILDFNTVTLENIDWQEQDFNMIKEAVNFFRGKFGV